ncbi:FKBP-type peptidyl-prolyl cis-trans isomerase [Methanoculleus chikugoensis]|uniref:FKBP-type peptidyl-prolyl cis-trans isomerase n=1 Tax=Methanoculleus chikugoensis TaxID=118126 RepID=UPI000ACA4B7C|nr:FKBP-type peptidyl-prolyl cis-trans isomerase [Methanoculleus chikugoensis]
MSQATAKGERVKSGDAVLVHYTGTLDNGTVFDSSAGREPLRFTVGTGRVIPGFDEGVVGMQVGEEKTLQIPADRAYGPYREDLIFAIDPAGIAGVENLTVGDQVGLSLQNGRCCPQRSSPYRPMRSPSMRTTTSRARISRSASVSSRLCRDYSTLFWNSLWSVVPGTNLTLQIGLYRSCRELRNRVSAVTLVRISRKLCISHLRCSCYRPSNLLISCDYT